MSVVQLRHVQKTSGSTVLIPHIDLEVTAGQCVVIQCNHELGHQLLLAMIGQTSISEGSIWIHGEALTPHNTRDIRRKIGIQLLSDTAYERLKVSEFLQFYARLYEAELDTDLLLQRLGLAEKRDSRVSRLTSSEVRRLSIARALVHNPQVLFMEDPEQNVDLETSYIIRNLIPALMEEGTAIIITTMVLEQAISMTNDVYLYSHSGFKKLETAEEEQNLLNPNDRNRDREPVISMVGKQVSTPTAADSVTKNFISAEVFAKTQSEEAENQVTLIRPNTTAEMESGMETKPEDAEISASPDKSLSTETGASVGTVDLDLQSEPAGSQVPVFVQPMRFEKIPAKVGDKLILFDPTEIDYIESHEGVANLHVLQGTYACSMSLSDLEGRLKGFGFYRCHRSYLVNLQKVREVITWTRNSYSLILDDQTKSSIPLSKSKYDELKEIIGI
ncbi:LytTR family transcriptional regulator DNA-binding domain-containing protein [Paenibacillus lautus]|uniref:LytTR family transcriptional regulator DNA-binding domain-containing protein n=1 Tax=Paenibacillus lautus TaxID=1401 RepID=UPI002DD33A30|nr:LytTR family transcriptional regulator DNA-binding domain-containing protein [Paenibacillus lautus]